ncbi:MAG: hypothetical protein EZS28_041967 [Streblomastix strix]|uniref:Reverse transcriptase domain-containing protein n=1 Tax=Streblomastix strix TaxID=222440 RepID=A0A5J4TVK3_9EUKA|nr:MAG: hypothetical protein EZS28_041967 [Streblomastix strix]
MPFATKHSPIYFATAMEPIILQIRMKTKIRIINYVDDIRFLRQNKEYLKNMTQRVIDTLKYFGFAMNKEKGKIEPNQTVIFLGWDWNLANATVKTKPTCSGFRMLDMVVILFELLGGEMRGGGLVRCSNLQVQLFISPRSNRAS